MTWFDTVLSDDQAEVVELVSAARASLPTADDLDADPALLADARSGLVESGIWSIAMAEDVGGGGAPLELRQAAYVALGGSHAALVWASAQAHAAADVLASTDPEAAAAVASGELPVAVVELDGIRVTGHPSSGGSINVVRIDAAGEDPAVLLIGGGEAWWVPASAVTHHRPLQRTGLGGAATSAVTIDSGDAVHITGIESAAVRSSLSLGCAAAAAGLMVVAAEVASAYAAARIQFGRPIAELPTVAASLHDQRDAAGVAVRLALVDALGSAEAARGIAVRATDQAVDATAVGIQIHGGYGYLKEYGAERLLRDAVSLRAAAI